VGAQLKVLWSKKRDGFLHPKEGGLSQKEEGFKWGIKAAGGSAAGQNLACSPQKEHGGHWKKK